MYLHFYVYFFCHLLRAAMRITQKSNSKDLDIKFAMLMSKYIHRMSTSTAAAATRIRRKKTGPNSKKKSEQRNGGAEMRYEYSHICIHSFACVVHVSSKADPIFFCMYCRYVHFHNFPFFVLFRR